MRTTLPLLFMLAACGETTGRRVLLHTEVATDLEASRTFTNSSGWAVTLDQAVISTGAFYYYDGEPAFTQAKTTTLELLWAAINPIGTAYAHPGHYLAGNAMGQLLEPYTLDLLTSPAKLPDGQGTSGDFRSATFSFAAPSAGPEVDTLKGHVALTRGHATKGEVTVYFEAVADLADLEHTAKEGQITGCVFEATDIETNGTVLVTIKPKVWFSLVDFSEVGPGDAEHPTTLAEGSTARIAFALGLTQLSAYQLSFQTP